MRPPYRLLIFFALVCYCCSSCETLKQSSKYQFTEGLYSIKEQHKSEKAYVLPGTDTIKVYRLSALKAHAVDTTKAVSFAFTPVKPARFNPRSFRHRSFDLDVLTVLFKYRPPAKGFPPQFNATFNGALFAGYRNDVYRLSYKETPMHIFKRIVTHYGYSAGFFSGFGSARIDEYVTNNALSIQYDGLVNLSGAALILAVDKLTAGLTFGVDHLLDRNRKLWVNNGRPWIGLSLGLNLN